MMDDRFYQAYAELRLACEGSPTLKAHHLKEFTGVWNRNEPPDLADRDRDRDAVAGGVGAAYSLSFLEERGVIPAAVAA